MSKQYTDEDVREHLEAAKRAIADDKNCKQALLHVLKAGEVYAKVPRPPLTHPSVFYEAQAIFGFLEKVCLRERINIVPSSLGHARRGRKR